MTDNKDYEPIKPTVPGELGPAAKGRKKLAEERNQAQAQRTYTTGVELGTDTEGVELTHEQKLQAEAIGQGGTNVGVNVEDENRGRVLQKQLSDMIKEANQGQDDSSTTAVSEQERLALDNATPEKTGRLREAVARFASSLGKKAT